MNFLYLRHLLKIKRMLNKVVEAVFINKPITDIAKLAKVRGVLNPQKEAEETTKQNNGKRPLPQ